MKIDLEKLGIKPIEKLVLNEGNYICCGYQAEKLEKQMYALLKIIIRDCIDTENYVKEHGCEIDQESDIELIESIIGLSWAEVKEGLGV